MLIQIYPSKSEPFFIPAKGRSTVIFKNYSATYTKYYIEIFEYKTIEESFRIQNKKSFSWY